MLDLVLRNFSESLLQRIDEYIRLIEERNPSKEWSRTGCISSLLVRSLAEIEGSELRGSRRGGGGDRRRARRDDLDRRQGPSDRRQNPERRKRPYPDLAEMVIDEILKQRPGSTAESDGDGEDTWRGGSTA